MPDPKLTRVELFEDSAGEYRCRIRAKNSEIIFSSSEGYKRPEDALANLAAVADALIAGWQVVEVDE